MDGADVGFDEGADDTDGARDAECDGNDDGDGVRSKEGIVDGRDAHTPKIVDSNPPKLPPPSRMFSLS